MQIVILLPLGMEPTYRLVKNIFPFFPVLSFLLASLLVVDQSARLHGWPICSATTTSLGMVRLLLACYPSGVARRPGERERDELFSPFVEGLQEEFSKLRKKLGKKNWKVDLLELSFSSSIPFFIIITSI